MKGKSFVAMALLVGFLLGVSGIAYGATTVTVLMVDEPPGRALEEMLPDFEAKTGIEVEMTIMPWDGVTDKCKLEAATKSDSYDVYAFDNLLSKIFIPIGSFEPLEEYRASHPGLPDLELDGLPPGTVEWYGTDSEGRVVSVSWFVSNRSHMYRKDLFEDPKEKANFEAKYGYELVAPVTWDQYRDVCEFFTRDTDGDGKIDFWGTTKAFGIGVAWDHFDGLYSSFAPIEDGKWWFNDEGEPIFNNEKAWRTVSFLKDLVDSGFISPGYMKKSWGDNPLDFLAGNTAMTDCWGSFQTLAEDPKFSKVVGKVGYTIIPKFEEHHTIIGAWQIAVNKYSKNKDAAYRFVQWAASEEIDLKGCLETQFLKLPCRTATFSNPDVLAKHPFLEVQAEGFLYSKPIPLVAVYERTMEVVSIAIQNVITGKMTPEEAFGEAEEIIRKAL